MSCYMMPEASEGAGAFHETSLIRGGMLRTCQVSERLSDVSILLQWS